MHHTNHYYGHAQLMARYAGLADWRQPPRIWGYLQHGWNVHHGFDPTAELVSGLPKLVWSDGPRTVGQRLGLPDYHVVGAPWAYLLALEPDLGTVPERTGTIFYPFHGWEQQPVTGDHRELAATINDHETGPVTVCLYWLEYQQAEVRRAYERAGFRVITHGRRGGHSRDSDVAFLYRQLDELRRHRRVASNRLGTAVLYGASVGCEVGVYGNPMELADDAVVPGGAARIRAEWAELHTPAAEPDVAEKVAQMELGLDRRRTPGEIVELFGWRRCADARSGRSYAVASHMDTGADDLRAQVSWLDQALQDKELELRRVRASTSYRLGNSVVRPVGSALRRLGLKGTTR